MKDPAAQPVETSADQPANHPAERRRFEPAKLVLGLSLLALAAGYLLREHGELDVSARVLALLLPCALLLTLLVAGLALLVRRARGRRALARGRSGGRTG
ncbi:hypothetical protein [Streptomyces sp. WMMC897]|uniref:hypothetical protein n=1 Tax=Streptomyces sp. WMMC897 TaxID=3014782 RepID=UPI0022B6059D|nr:hypothetical protein [Streptomyces sp. WMMC897]MCZ7417105.1 hypothetical protein [Streptomyces sp. WMMC897]